MPIIVCPNPILSQVCQPVDHTDPRLPEIIAEMKRVMNLGDAGGPGQGLAASQIGLTLCIIVTRNGAYLNPTWTPWVGGDTETKLEGCLSYPNRRFDVTRHKRINVKWTSLTGHAHTDKLAGLAARVWQHECDHCQGINIWDNHA